MNELKTENCEQFKDNLNTAKNSVIHLNENKTHFALRKTNPHGKAVFFVMFSSCSSDTPKQILLRLQPNSPMRQ